MAQAFTLYGYDIVCLGSLCPKKTPCSRCSIRGLSIELFTKYQHIIPDQGDDSACDNCNCQEGIGA